MNLEFTQKSQFQPVNRETWLGEGDVLHYLVFFTQIFPGPLKLSNLGHCSCAVPTFHWHRHGMVCLECLHPPKYFWIKLIPFPWKTSVVQHLLHRLLYFWIWTKSWKLQGPGPLLKSSINPPGISRIPTEGEQTWRLLLQVQTIFLFCFNYLLV